MSFNEYQIHEISLGKMNDRLPCNIECLDDEKILEWNCITKDKHRIYYPSTLLSKTVFAYIASNFNLWT